MVLSSGHGAWVGSPILILPYSSVSTAPGAASDMEALLRVVLHVRCAQQLLPAIALAGLSDCQILLSRDHVLERLPAVASGEQ